MPFRKTYRKNVKRKSRYRRKKAQNRQQMLSVSTVKKIAKQVAGRLDTEKTPSFRATVDFGEDLTTLTDMSENLPIGDNICMAGVYDWNTRNFRIEDFWGPATVPMVAETAADITVLEDGYRLGDQVFLKGIQLRGVFILPSTLPRATCSFVICRKKGLAYIPASSLLPHDEFIVNPWLNNYTGDLAGHLAMKVEKRWDFHMIQKSGRDTGNANAYRDLYKKVNIYHSVKRKLTLQELSELDDAETANKADFLKPPYEFRIFSDQIKTLDDESLGNLNSMPQFRGQVIYHYTSS